MRNRALTFVVALAFAVLFVFLGLWQLGRANAIHELSQSKKDIPPIQIEKLTKPNSNLNNQSTNRLATLQGRYIKTYIAPNQKVELNGSAESKDLEVRLLRLNSGSAILVVRGIADLNNQIIPGEVNVLGRLYPRQSSDFAKFQPGSLTRLDPSLVVSDTNLKLLDGYVIAIKEVNKLGQSISAERIAAKPVLPKVAGFFWQHISYVIIWWLFAMLVLIAPFYDLLRDRKIRVK